MLCCSQALLGRRHFRAYDATALVHLRTFLLHVVSDKQLLDLSYVLKIKKKSINKKAFRFIQTKYNLCFVCTNSDCHELLPLTCCSRVMITSTAMFRMPSFVCGLSDFRWVLHIRPSSFRASLMSRIRILQCQEQKEKLSKADFKNI